MGILGDIADGLIDGATEIVSQGADEAAKALFTGNGFVRDQMPPAEAAEAATPVEAAPIEAPAVEAPPPQSGWGEQAPMGFPEIGHSDNATIIDMEPQIQAQSFDQLLESYAASAPPPEMEQGMER